MSRKWKVKGKGYYMFLTFSDNSLGKVVGIALNMHTHYEETFAGSFHVLVRYANSYVSYALLSFEVQVVDSHVSLMVSCILRSNRGFQQEAGQRNGNEAEVNSRARRAKLWKNLKAKFLQQDWAAGPKMSLALAEKKMHPMHPIHPMYRIPFSEDMDYSTAWVTEAGTSLLWWQPSFWLLFTYLCGPLSLLWFRTSPNLSYQFKKNHSSPWGVPRTINSACHSFSSKKLSLIKCETTPPNASRLSKSIEAIRYKVWSAIRRNQQKLIKDLVARHQASAGHDWTGPTFVLFLGRFLFVTKSCYFWQFSFKDKQLKVECLFAGCTWTRARIAKECTSRVTSPASTRPLIKKPNMRNKKPNNNHLLIHHLFLAFSPKKKLGEKATSFLWVFDAFWWFFARQDDGRHLWWGNSWSNRHKVDGAFRRTAAGKLRTVARGNGWKVDVSSFSSWNFWMCFFLKKKDGTFGRLNRDGFFRRILERWMLFLKETIFPIDGFSIEQGFWICFWWHTCSCSDDRHLSPWPGLAFPFCWGHQFKYRHRWLPLGWTLLAARAIWKSRWFQPLGEVSNRWRDSCNECGVAGGEYEVRSSCRSVA